jgi:hypothetical protein
MKWNGSVDWSHEKRKSGWEHRPPLECHIVLLWRGVHVWMYLTSNFWKNFIIFLHIMLKYNLKNILKKNYFISFYKVRGWNIFVETNVMYQCTKKKQLYFKNNFKIIYNIYESWRYENQVISHSLNHVWIPYDQFENLTSNHIHMEDEKHN